MQIQDRTFLVTGGSLGIGRALAATLLEDGARVTITARGARDLAQAARDLGGGNALLAVAGDVSVDADAARMVAATVARFGGLDVLVNNAAVLPAPAPIEETPSTVWDEVLRINVTGTANLVRHALPAMRARGRGVVVNLSSGWGRSADADVAPYCASKFAVEGLTQSLAAEVPAGFVALALNPGVIATRMLGLAFGAEAQAYPGPASLAPAWRRLFAGLDASFNGRSLNLLDFLP